jgi:hypothetical protein
MPEAGLLNPYQMEAIARLRDYRYPSHLIADEMNLPDDVVNAALSNMRKPKRRTIRNRKRREGRAKRQAKQNV